ncbi:MULTISPECIES: magnesium/cobalt transporter CorA [unclassified Halomonas]|uniref:magnesium/cobalt transporter CorA n=1 Tax=unclassified Halomonas TaxID=2609666 RepID=UPI002884B8EF|nr:MULTISPECIES: magnesium/cobalt transporter CorA [unclassified Halomonas]MDT0502194.1 magnesium/cobalt transporter CorA [Halomonas sp. PAR7]MDT0513578.1 magnesium/cobalt transporter CorA [Halomonas sp. LES1]MDT0592996.1 magnesium/cobalt transporter CorA [Halomonas sp. PAR8]
MLINCVVYDKGHRLHDIQPDQIGDYLGQPDRFVWVALHDPSAQEMAHYQEAFGLHELAVEDTLKGDQRPKLEEYDSALFMIMHMVSMTEGELQSGQVAVFAGPGYVLSVRLHPGQGFAEVRRRCESDPKLLSQGPAFVLYALLDAVVDHYFPMVQALEAELESIEDQIFVQGSARTSLERLYQLKRQTMQLKHAAMPLGEAVSHLFGGRVPALCRETREYFRDVYDHLHRIESAVDTIREMIITAIQVNLSMVAIDEGEVNKRLAAWAAIFGVATIFAGIWGMNFTHMPELDWRIGYPLALLAMGGACGALYRRFRRAGWL